MKNAPAVEVQKNGKRISMVVNAFQAFTPNYKTECNYSELLS